MNEKQLIQQIKKLQEIQPKKEWVVLTKQEIFGEARFIAKESKPLGILDVLISISFPRKLAYSFATLLFVFLGLFGFAQYTVPGDPLFSVRKITEQSSAALSGQTGLQYNIANLNKRLDDLTQVARDKRTNNIPSAVQEVRQSVSEVAKNIKENLNTGSQSIREIAVEVSKIQDSKEQLQTLGIDLGETSETKELNDALASLAQMEINDLEKTTLTEDQQETLQEIKDLYIAGDYSGALEKILLINN